MPHRLNDRQSADQGTAALAAFLRLLPDPGDTALIAVFVGLIDQGLCRELGAGNGAAKVDPDFALRDRTGAHREPVIVVPADHQDAPMIGSEARQVLASKQLHRTRW